MEYEVYIIETGVKVIKYLTESYEYSLKPDLERAMGFDSIDDAKECIKSWDLKCLRKIKKCRIKKLVCKLEEIDYNI